MLKIIRGKLTKVFSMLKAIKLRSPKKNRIAVIDTVRIYDINSLLGDIPYTPISNRSEEIYVGIGLLLEIIKTSYRKKRKSGQGLLSSFLHSICGSNGNYLEACISYSQPQYVFTLIDNNPFIFNVSALFPNIKFIAIQAASRMESHISRIEPSNPNHVYYFCLSEYERSIFPRYGYDKSRMIPAGSLLEALWMERKKNVPRRYDICVSSQWRKEFFDTPSSAPIFRDAQTKVYRNIARLVKEENYTCCVASVRKNDEEISYFREIFGPNVFINDSTTDFSTYDLMEASTLVITLNSTSGREAVSIGSRVIFNDPPSEETIHDPNDKLWSKLYLIEDDYRSLYERAKTVLNMTDEDYENEYGESCRYIIQSQKRYTTKQRLLDFMSYKT
ncbi:hypothetical protein RYZ26_09340 [Terasakiella sp. A23]|uniref:hypothetical protein n=1 Tax=Terasakiella sp. FCG-A23 TaxID=3080561 RepID=UPI00295457FD|nr:hypothetical protein [Terasakiella sp. A23]MDV7339795.1 hypothetical protein [Terasakiella sp. A23]